MHFKRGGPDEKARICHRLRLAFFSTAAFADSKPADDEAGEDQADAHRLGLQGGTFEKETEASSCFEADDVKCKDGNQYDVKFDGSFKVLSITRD